ncbi:hypothetical protein GCM10023165_24370 [Variovorax defluvii]|uniref:Uncharacterized protein n=1 Tax=Variovorax defluvii TaxID=913761 RepID=A0ABP8HQ44_9BURK
MLPPERGLADHTKWGSLGESNILRGTGFAGPLVLPPARGLADHTKWGSLGESNILRGTGFAGPLVLPPARGLAKRHEVREDWG